MASCWIPQLLALEVSTTTRQAQGDSRSSAADPRERSYARYYNGVRTHLSLAKDSPVCTENSDPDVMVMKRFRNLSCNPIRRRSGSA